MGIINNGTTKSSQKHLDARSETTSNIITHKIPTVIAIIAGITGVLLGLLSELNFYLIILLDTVLVIISLTIFYIIDALRFKKQIKEVVKLYKEIDRFKDTSLQNNIRRYVDNTRGNLSTLISKLGKEEIILDEIQFDRILEIMFATKLTYKAIDITLPSEYRSKYPKYLDAHEKSLDPNVNIAEKGDRTRGYRVILKETSDIESDSKKSGYKYFYEWHENNGVDLRHLSEQSAETIIQKYGINIKDCNLGIGVWGNAFAIMFSRYDDPDKTTRSGERAVLHIFENTGLHKEDFKILENICDEIYKKSHEMYKDRSPRLLNDFMINEWINYVIPTKRWKIVKPFFNNFFEKYKKGKIPIIDIAAGAGFEYYFMKQEGFVMDANEFQDTFRDAGEKYRISQGYDEIYSPFEYSWSEIINRGKNERYVGLFAIGNSLRMIKEDRDQREAITAFYKLLQEDGTIIIDERNHEYLLNYTDTINQCGIMQKNNEVFEKLLEITHKIPNPLYHGKDFLSIPYKVSEDKKIITSCYYKNTPEHGKIGSFDDLDDVTEKEKQIWSFHHHSPLEDLLKNAGFVDIKKYADYDLARPLGIYDTDDKASMFVYVARKSGSV